MKKLLLFLSLLFECSCTEALEPTRTVPARNSSDLTISPAKVFCVENDVIFSYLNEVSYKGFQYSSIQDYANERGYKMDWPRPFEFPFSESLIDEEYHFKLTDILVDSLCYQGIVSKEQAETLISNMKPSRVYLYELFRENDNSSVLKDTVMLNGRLRMIKVSAASNMRDLGGWITTDSSSVRYGKILRGGRLSGLSEKERSFLKDNLNIKVEIDLRSNEELRLTDDNPLNDLNYSLLGEEIDYYHCPLPLHGGFLSEYEMFAKVFRIVLEEIRQDKTVYIHCAGGADRTGAIVMMMEFALGLTDDGIAKDYELTSFATGYYDNNNLRTCERCQTVLDRLSRVSGQKATNQETICSFLKSQGITESEIQEFKQIMIKK